ncbi:MAG: hypothetical protein HY695_37985 [Deltaproteobacteria bacterium]|nr:hypothetical protein [Deltaproteobacteria bacterium]
MQLQKSTFSFAVAVVFGGLVLPLTDPAFSQTDFYKGKTITLIQGRRPGGTGDVRVRALIPFLQKHIPGNPTIITEFIPGAGGRKAANHLYSAVKPDGLTIGNIGAGFVSNAVLGEPGVQYDVDKMIYLGSPNSRTSYLFFTTKTAALDSLEKLRAASSVRIGAQSVGHDNYIIARLFAWILDLKDPKFVTGYSGPEVDLALLGGEVDARANSSETVFMRNREWLGDGPVRFHAVIEIPRGFRLRHPALERVPELESFAHTKTQKLAISMFRNFRLVGSPYILPPNTPKEQVGILQQAFRKALKDPEFLETWKKLTKMEAQPLLPEEQHQTVKEIPRDPETIKLFNQIAGGGPLPGRQ